MPRTTGWRFESERGRLVRANVSAKKELAMSREAVVSARVDEAVKIPNAETLAAIEAAHRGETEIVTLDELQSMIVADD